MAVLDGVEAVRVILICGSANSSKHQGVQRVALPTQMRYTCCCVKMLTFVNVWPDTGYTCSLQQQAVQSRCCIAYMHKP